MFIKLILIMYAGTGVSMVDVNIGDTWGNGGFYFSTLEKCEAVGKQFDKRDTYTHSHICLIGETR
jgi:hypothetical protein